MRYYTNIDFRVELDGERRASQASPGNALNQQNDDLLRQLRGPSGSHSRSQRKILAEEKRARRLRGIPEDSGLMKIPPNPSILFTN